MNIVRAQDVARRDTAAFEENEEGGWTAYYPSFRKQGHVEYTGDGETKEEAKADLESFIRDEGGNLLWT